MPSRVALAVALGWPSWGATQDLLRPLPGPDCRLTDDVVATRFEFEIEDGKPRIFLTPLKTAATRTFCSETIFRPR